MRMGRAEMETAGLDGPSLRLQGGKRQGQAEILRTAPALLQPGQTGPSRLHKSSSPDLELANRPRDQVPTVTLAARLDER